MRFIAALVLISLAVTSTVSAQSPLPEGVRPLLQQLFENAKTGQHHNNLGEIALVYVRIEEPDRALAIVQQIKSEFWREYMLREIGRVAAERSHVGAALEALKLYHPDDTAKYSFLPSFGPHQVAYLLAEAGRHDEAMKVAGQIQNEADRLAAQFWVCQLAAETSDPMTSKARFEALLKLDRDELTEPSLVVARAVAHARFGNVSQARAALQADPKDWTLQRKIPAALAQAGKALEAMKLAQSIANEDDRSDAVSGVIAVLTQREEVNPPWLLLLEKDESMRDWALHEIAVRSATDRNYRAALDTAGQIQGVDQRTTTLLDIWDVLEPQEHAIADEIHAKLAPLVAMIDVLYSKVEVETQWAVLRLRRESPQEILKIVERLDKSLRDRLPLKTTRHEWFELIQLSKVAKAYAACGARGRAKDALLYQWQITENCLSQRQIIGNMIEGEVGGVVTDMVEIGQFKEAIRLAQLKTFPEHARTEVLFRLGKALGKALEFQPCVELVRAEIAAGPAQDLILIAAIRGIEENLHEKQTRATAGDK